tara:strand:- start:723 stop:1064 length:342 start_codon:yes stop_codon:yes gene_type:complete
MLDKIHFKVMNHLVNKEEMFAKPAIEITRAEMTKLIKSKKLMRVWSTKLNGASMRRVMKTGSPTGGKSGNPRYKQKGQWVMKSDTNDGEWRTIVLKTVDKIKTIGDDQFYKVR